MLLIMTFVDNASFFAGDFRGFVPFRAIVRDEIDVDEALGIIQSANRIDQVSDDGLFVSRGQKEGVPVLFLLLRVLPLLGE